jgi:hypothetical protein
MSPIFVPPVPVVSVPVDLVEVVKTNLGDLAVLATDAQILAWLNEGVRRFPGCAEKEASITWTSNSSNVQLPDDYVRLERLHTRQGCLPPFDVLGKRLVFGDPLISGGNGILYYWGYFSPIVAGQPTGLPPVGEVAAVNYALSRFYRMLSGNRADYRRYATIAGQNGVDIGELDALAERHHQDFLEARDELENIEYGEPATFYGG